MGYVLAVAAGEAGGELTGVVLSDTLVVYVKELDVVAAAMVFVFEIVLEDLTLGLTTGAVDAAPNALVTVRVLLLLIPVLVSLVVSSVKVIFKCIPN